MFNDFVAHPRDISCGRSRYNTGRIFTLRAKLRSVL